MADHVITETEIAALSTKGVRFEHPSSCEPVKFINEFFGGLALEALFEQLTELLRPAANCPPDVSVHLDDSDPPILLIQYHACADREKSERLVIERTFIRYPDELVVDHDYFSLPEHSQNQGIAKQVTATFAAQYETMGVSRIRVQAGLKDGGLVWALFGFKATKKTQVRLILETARLELPTQQFALVKRFYDAYYDKEPDGAAFPIEDWGRLKVMQEVLRGSYWEGELNLKDPKELVNFKDYVTR